MKLFMLYDCGCIKGVTDDGDLKLLRKCPLMRKKHKCPGLKYKKFEPNTIIQHYFRLPQQQDARVRFSFLSDGRLTGSVSYRREGKKPKLIVEALTKRNVIPTSVPLQGAIMEQLNKAMGKMIHENWKGLIV